MTCDEYLITSMELMEPLKKTSNQSTRGEQSKAAVLKVVSGGFELQMYFSEEKVRERLPIKLHLPGPLSYQRSLSSSDSDGLHNLFWCVPLG